MARYILLFFTLFMIVSCASETETVTEHDAKDFLAEVQETAEIEGPVISSAYWISSNFITYDSQIVAADFSKRYTLMGLEQAREAAKFDELKSEAERDGTVLPSIDHRLLCDNASLRMSKSSSFQATWRLLMHCHHVHLCR